MKVINYCDVAPTVFPAPARGTTGRVVLGKADGATNFCMRVIEFAPGGETSRHSHPWEHEQFVHEGTGQVLIEDRWFDVGPGSVLFIPSGVTHQIKNSGAVPLVIVCLVPPFAPELL
ncbi:cupin domain-containing protein [Desulfolutivibrio sp.]|uniref:cupin domain-containing protein n=1 Tax=Desulfolutivibrio sp. TaxID=2773296 RepID=UPI002F96D951